MKFSPLYTSVAVLLNAGRVLTPGFIRQTSPTPGFLQQPSTGSQGLPHFTRGCEIVRLPFGPREYRVRESGTTAIVTAKVSRQPNKGLVELQVRAQKAGWNGKGFAYG